MAAVVARAPAKVEVGLVAARMAAAEATAEVEDAKEAGAAAAARAEATMEVHPVDAAPTGYYFPRRSPAHRPSRSHRQRRSRRLRWTQIERVRPPS